jgi:LacI family transcriptional regulator
MGTQNNGPTGRVTLKDVATATGYSVNTVSHALKNKPDIAEATRKAIRQRAQEMGYIADLVAGSMRSGSTRTIAVILGDVSNPHFGIWVREIEETAYQKGYSTLIINTNENADIEMDAVKTAIGKRVDGILICPTQKCDDCIALLRSSSIPFVLIGRRPEGQELDYVVLDDEKGGLIATRHLLKRGHRNILFLNGPEYISSARERLRGYLAAYAEAGVPADRSLIRPVGITSGECRKVLRQCIREEAAFTAILAFSDIVGLEALYELNQSAKAYAQVPVLGFDNICRNLYLPVPLDSVASVDGSPAVVAAELMIKRIGQKRAGEWDDRPHPVVLDVKLFHHGSNL